MSTETEIDKLTQEIENKLKFYGQDFFTEVKNDSEIFLNYPRHIEGRIFDHVNNYIF